MTQFAVQIWDAVIVMTDVWAIDANLAEVGSGTTIPDQSEPTAHNTQSRRDASEERTPVHFFSFS